MKKFTLLMAAALVGVSASAQLYVTGDNVTGATEAWAPAAPLELTAQNGVYSFTAKGNFKISTAKSTATGDWSGFNGGAKMLDGSWNKDKVAGTASATLKNGDTNILSPMGDTETLITYTVREDLSTINATLPEGVTFPVDQILDMYMVGNMTSWTPNNANYKMNTTDGKVYTLEGLNLAADAQFKFCGGSWGVRELTGGKYGEAGSVMSLGSGAGNITLSSAMENVTVKLTVLNDDFSAGTLEIIGGGEETMPEHFYILGHVNGATWAPDNAVEMTKTETGFEAKFTIGNSGAGDAFFSFTESTAADWDSLGQRWGAPTNDYELNAGDSATIQPGDNAFKVVADQEIILTLDWATKKLTYNIVSGVAAVEAANGEAVYFNMQGVRVANPENGLFIRVQNGKAVKVVK